MFHIASFCLHSNSIWLLTFPLDVMSNPWPRPRTAAVYWWRVEVCIRHNVYACSFTSFWSWSPGIFASINPFSIAWSCSKRVDKFWLLPWYLRHIYCYPGSATCQASLYNMWGFLSNFQILQELLASRLWMAFRQAPGWLMLYLHVPYPIAAILSVCLLIVDIVIYKICSVHSHPTISHEGKPGLKSASDLSTSYRRLQVAFGGVCRCNLLLLFSECYLATKIICSVSAWTQKPYILFFFRKSYSWQTSLYLWFLKDCIKYECLDKI